MDSPTTSTNSRMSWLRAALLAPLAIVAMGPIAGSAGHVHVPFDAISGGEAFWMMFAMHALFLIGMFLYLAGLFILYMLLVINGTDAFARETRSRTILLLLGMATGYLLNVYVDKTVIVEIASARLKTETIMPDKWHVRSCGRGSSICLDFQGSLGHASIKSHIGSSEMAAEILQNCQAILAGHAALQVEWGRTTLGWNAARKATCGKLGLRNDWI